MDRLTSISVFVTALEKGSLVAAGRCFGLSPSMAGKHVSALEAQLGVRLLQRSTRKLSATDAGRAYYARCKGIIEAWDEANHEASDTGISVRGTLRVAVPVTFGALYMGDVMAGLLRDHPDLNVELIADDRFIDLHAAGIDVAIRIGELADSSLIARRLCACRMVMCASPDFIERHGLPTTPVALRALPRLAFSEAVSGDGWTIRDTEGRPFRVDGPIRAQANNMQMLLSMTLAGLGIAYGPTFVFGQALREGNLVALLPDFCLTELAIHAVYPTARYVPSKLRCFIDHVASALAGTLPWEQR
ncbi:MULTISPECIES: LysR family transcriptional regulator [unclassified Pseudomonas]|uniref:LysR family transcriptional regulator n=1 Tax=unclassified Pseudomonas TaxID=196821 RepID=UPI00384E591C